MAYQCSLSLTHISINSGKIVKCKNVTNVSYLNLTNIIKKHPNAGRVKMKNARDYFLLHWISSTTINNFIEILC